MRNARAYACKQMTSTGLTGGALVSRCTCAREHVDPVSARGAVMAGI